MRTSQQIDAEIRECQKSLGRLAKSVANTILYGLDHENTRVCRERYDEVVARYNALVDEYNAALAAEKRQKFEDSLTDEQKEARAARMAAREAQRAERLAHRYA